MSGRSGFYRLDLSRRRLLSAGALLAAGGAMLGAAAANSARASSKAAQNSVSYRPKPQGRARCDNCSQWQPPAACKLVDGQISPSGWCAIYAPKS